MEDNYLLALSLLYRNTKKYFDHSLSQYNLGWGQVLPLLMVNEHAGITMQELTQRSVVDKGTTSKVVQNLLDNGYLKVKIDEQDRRVKHLYTTSKASDIISSIYHYRQEYGQSLAKDVDFSHFLEELTIVMKNSEANDKEEDKDFQSLRIGKYKNLDLGNYPDKVSATIYLSGCNLKCPFCNQKDLVFLPQEANLLDVTEVLEDLKSRTIFLEAVCISGGEPCQQEALIPFLVEIKKLGLSVKLETNGTFPYVLESLIQRKLVDYIQLDWKNASRKIPETVGLLARDVPIRRMKESLKLVQCSGIPYEIHTTLVKAFHGKKDVKQMYKELEGDKHWKLYPFRQSNQVIQKDLVEWSEEEWEKISHVES
ncbi:MULTISPECIES: anaerobic ribonucleoside-triphosphate reductase activating protein [Terrabacteria group]|uniref:anaerobic ribonucleoside-triphosphate reductase activating protein n=1 Tax=Bacillati TaxID=1783272 RepID=UPI0019396811|nr:MULTISPECIES: anaerobic ribonucleoside-triphosphate reductase activating protein [Terrabacteria group]MBW9212950.1 anaerobic ribonucleoside-triphosphate reductase activating protein [Trueperella sp. zg.1013]QRG87011.1 anaerobic ribonucleoside-triphosphate reductase activating protein [Bulleidia sp. zg-1006]